MKFGKLAKYVRKGLAMVIVMGLSASCQLTAKASVWEDGEGKEPEIIFNTYGSQETSYTDGGWWIANTARYTENEDGSIGVRFEYPPELYVVLERMRGDGTWESVAEGYHDKSNWVDWIHGLTTYVSEIGPWCYDRPGIYRYAMTYAREDGTRTEMKYSEVLDLSTVTNKVNLPEVKISNDGKIVWENQGGQQASSGAVYRTRTIAYNTYGGQRTIYDGYDSADKTLDYVNSFYLWYPDDWGEIPDYWSISDAAWELDLNSMLAEVLREDDYEGYNFAFELQAASGNLEAALNSSEIETTICFTRDLELVKDDGSHMGDAARKVQNFVSRMYTIALGREAEEAGLNDWTNRLLTHEIDGAGIANGFIMSDEFKNRNLSNETYVDTLYRTFFDREADQGGRATWLAELAAGKSRSYVLSGFVNSAEFDNLCDAYGIARGTMREDGSPVNAGIRQFVERCYTKVLGREGEKAGVEDWTNRITTDQMSAEDVAKSFFFSDEYTYKNTGNEIFVETLYQTFMNRSSDSAGKSDWVERLNQGTSRQEVLEGFSRSEEFSKILRSYGL